MSRNVPRRLLPFFLLVLTACDKGQPQPPGTPGEGAGGSPPASSRLAWSQQGASLSSVQAYHFRLFVDGSPTDLAGASCSGPGAPADFDCSAPLPRLSAGRRMLELAAV